MSNRRKNYPSLIQEQQYGWQNNIEITRIPNSISDDNLESAVVNVLSKVQCATNVYKTVDDIEVCHRIGKSKGNLLFVLLIGSIENVP